MTKPDEWNLRLALDHVPNLPLDCVRRLVELPQDYKDKKVDSTVDLDVSTTNFQCLDALEDIMLCGRFRIGDTRYLVKTVTNHRTEPVISFQAVGINKSHWLKEFEPHNGALHRSRTLHA